MYVSRVARGKVGRTHGETYEISQREDKIKV